VPPQRHYGWADLKKDALEMVGDSADGTRRVPATFRHHADERVTTFLIWQTRMSTPPNIISFYPNGGQSQLDALIENPLVESRNMAGFFLPNASASNPTSCFPVVQPQDAGAEAEHQPCSPNEDCHLRGNLGQSSETTWTPGCCRSMESATSWPRESSLFATSG